MKRRGQVITLPERLAIVERAKQGASDAATATHFHGYTLVAFTEHLRPSSSLRLPDYEEPQLCLGA